MTIDEAIVRVKKLSPKPGDTIVVRFDSSVSGALLGDVRYVLQKYLPEGAYILFLKDGFTLETMSEAKMEELGWVRKNKVEGDEVSSDDKLGKEHYGKS